jgi:hypothetical protein
MMAAKVNETLHGWSCSLAVMVVAALLGGSAYFGRSSAATTERVVTDYHTGLAISGFDPVAYFTKSQALLGKEDIEARLVGATWRFVNEGNRQAFTDNPEVYMPAFGGYDPTGVARGVAVAGHPMVWMITGERLYLFYSPQTRDAFVASPAQILDAARQKWPSVQSILVR